MPPPESANPSGNPSIAFLKINLESSQLSTFIISSYVIGTVIGRPGLAPSCCTFNILDTSDCKTWGLRKFIPSMTLKFSCSISQASEFKLCD